MADVDTDVLIVGGGPVGLALAGDLGWRGINCLLVEQTDGVIRTPKMNEVNLRSMEFCRRWGIDQKVMDCPFPNDYPMDICFVTSIGGYELGRMPRPAKKDQKPGDCAARRRLAPAGGEPPRALGTPPRRGQSGQSADLLPALVRPDPEGICRRL